MLRNKFNAWVEEVERPLTIEEEPNLSKPDQSRRSRTTEIPQLSPATWPRRYLEGMRVSRPHARTLPIPLMPMRSFEALVPPSVRQKKENRLRVELKAEDGPEIWVG